MSESKRKGTAAESAAVLFLRTQGWPHAERLALQGAHDRGDITGTPGICWEVKNCAETNLPGWLAEAAVERENAHADHGIVIAKPRGVGIKRVEAWHAVMYAGDMQLLLVQAKVDIDRGVWVLKTGPGYRAQLANLLLHVQDYAFQGRREFGMVEIAAKGVKDERRWYNVMALGDMARLLRKAGYGSAG